MLNDKTTINLISSEARIGLFLAISTIFYTYVVGILNSHYLDIFTRWGKLEVIILHFLMANTFGIKYVGSKICTDNVIVLVDKCVLLLSLKLYIWFFILIIIILCNEKDLFSVFYRIHLKKNWMFGCLVII